MPSLRRIQDSEKEIKEGAKKREDDGGEKQLTFRFHRLTFYTPKGFLSYLFKASKAYMQILLPSKFKLSFLSLTLSLSLTYICICMYI